MLTEPKWFLGSDQYLQEIARTVSLPCLRKDFTVDEYMIEEAKVLGASAVLLICAILTERQIRAYLHICDGLGLSALVEVHNEAEAEIAPSGRARIIGVNNRNLKDFCGPGQQPPASTLIPARCCLFPKAASAAPETSQCSGDGSGRSPDRRNSDAGV